MRVELVTLLSAQTFTRESITKQRGSPIWGFCKDLSDLTPPRAAEQAVPGPHHLRHRMMNSSKDQGYPHVLEREEMDFLSLIPCNTPVLPQPPLRPLSKTLSGITTLHDTPDASDTFPNHYSC